MACHGIHAADVVQRFSAQDRYPCLYVNEQALASPNVSLNPARKVGTAAKQGNQRVPLLQVLREAIQRYENVWLPLLANNGNGSNPLLVPPIDVEWVWHCHMLLGPTGSSFLHLLTDFLYCGLFLGCISHAT